MKVKKIKNALVYGNIEKKAFSDIINIDEKEDITREELKEILETIDSCELASDHVEAYIEELLKWYLDDTSRLYQYANESKLFVNKDVIELLQDGQRIYWEKEINDMRERLYNFLDKWDE